MRPEWASRLVAETRGQGRAPNIEYAASRPVVGERGRESASRFGGKPEWLEVQERAIAAFASGDDALGQRLAAERYPVGSLEYLKLVHHGRGLAIKRENGTARSPSPSQPSRSTNARRTNDRWRLSKDGIVAALARNDRRSAEVLASCYAERGSDAFHRILFECEGEAMKVQDQEASDRAWRVETSEARVAGSPAWLRWSTALHEAGHAVAGFLDGVKIEKVRISPDAPGHGECISDGRNRTAQYFLGGVAAVRVAVGKGVLAGGPTVNEYDGARQDIARATELLGGSKWSPKFRDVVESTEAVLRAHWGTLFTVADRLHRNHEMSGSELRQIITDGLAAT